MTMNFDYFEIHLQNHSCHFIKYLFNDTIQSSTIKEPVHLDMMILLEYYTS